jgi:hypothetical protein
MNLDSPAALIKVMVPVEVLHTGTAARPCRRALAPSGEERVGSNVGKGQMKAANYASVPDIVE